MTLDKLIEICEQEYKRTIPWNKETSASCMN